MQRNERFVKKQTICRAEMQEIVMSKRLLKFRIWVSYQRIKNRFFVKPQWLNVCEKEVNAVIDSSINFFFKQSCS